MFRKEVKIHKALGTWEDVPEHDQHICEEEAACIGYYENADPTSTVAHPIMRCDKCGKAL